MKFEYAQPFSFQIGRRPQSSVRRIRHGVTEIILSDGRAVRATLHVTSVKTDPNNPGSLEISYNIKAEILNVPNMPVRDAHQTIQ